MISNRLRKYLNNKNILLFCIVFIALILRIYNIHRIPPSLSWDEVSIGYNAYSIVKTGRDEHERFLPYNTFIGYGDYKPPFAVYATVPFVGIFGLNELAVRLPSALFGTLTVFMTYLLVKELFLNIVQNPKSKDQIKSKAQRLKINHLDINIDLSFGIGHLSFQEAIALISSSLLAISPWHINLSRAGFEANIALFFIVLGVYLILRSKVRPKLWIMCWLPFAVAIYTFNSSRYFTPIFSIGLIAYMYAEIKKNFRLFSIGVVIALIAVAPLLPHIMSKEARLRFAEVNIFTDASIVKTANERIERGKNSMVSKIVHNRRVGYMRSYLTHFLDNLQPDFLFIKGDGNPKFSIQDTGQLYLIEAPFLAIGIFSLFILYPKIAFVLVFWLIAAIIPAATARETPHALRILNSLPTWQIFIAFGIIMIVSSIMRHASRIKIKRFKNISVFVFCLLFIVLYAVSVSYYLHNYYRHYPKEFSGEWQYGYREALSTVQNIAQRYDKVVITDSIGRPYMYTLFYTRMDPNELFRIKESSFDDAGFYHVYGIGKYRFSQTMPSSIEPKTLYIWDAGFIPQGVRVIDTIRLLNGNAVLTIFDKGNDHI